MLSLGEGDLGWCLVKITLMLLQMLKNGMTRLEDSPSPGSLFFPHKMPSPCTP